MDEDKILSYLKLIKIKTLNGYEKYLYGCMASIFLTTALTLGIPTDIYNDLSTIIQSGIVFLNLGVTSLLVKNKYKKNKKEFIENNDIDVNTTVKECYEILKKEEIVKKTIPIDGMISRYYICTESYCTEKGKQLIRKR